MELPFLTIFTVLAIFFGVRIKMPVFTVVGMIGVVILAFNLIESENFSEILFVGVLIALLGWILVGASKEEKTSD